jgi:peptidyl-prolyl cis-trans isomerase A (cyclophilin A)
LSVKTSNETIDAVRVEITTAEGSFRIEVYPDKAPLSAGIFLAYVDHGYLAQGSFYRMTTPANEPDKPFPIQVAQFGWKWLEGGAGSPIPPIAHESTAETGIHHVKGTVSTARFALDNGGYGFFICMRDEPELDFGGRRHPDGHGFAAFGRVTSGWGVVERIYAHAEAQHMLGHPVPITSARRV